ncbi:MAG: DUF3861 domain-containing protein [Zoogloeaceae bacterium]|jgi:hypothetical protein|nr:DUF3861 domain-containing protein [Zoogloeaceae bacterium]
MKKYRYRLTLEPLEVPGVPASRVLSFEFDNHDDIFVILERVSQRGDFSAEEIPQLVLGLKLLGKTLMENKENALLASLKPHFNAFMRELKNSNPKETG